MFYTIAKEGLITGGIVGGSVLTGVTYDAAFHPEIGDTKDYSGTIDSSTSFGINMAMAYLGIKYGNKLVKAVSSKDNVLAKKGTMTAGEMAIAAMTTGVRVYR